MSNRNKSVAPYQGGGGGGLVPRNHQSKLGGAAPFDDFDRMADRMMANFGMPKMDLSRDVISFNFYFSDAFRGKGSIR